jgi:hypothetical protein
MIFMCQVVETDIRTIPPVLTTHKRSAFEVSLKISGAVSLAIPTGTATIGRARLKTDSAVTH